MKLTRWSTLVIAVLLVAVTVAAGACSSTKANQPPTITSLIAVPTSLAPGDGSTVTCTASDPDGDTLNYAWTCNGGAVSGTGAQVTWVAPSVAKSYSVTVTVSDGKGGTVNSSVSIAVAVPTPTPTPAPTDGSIDIKSNPAGAEVIIDGVDTGSITPYVATHVAVGNHTVKLVYSHYKWRTETVPVTAGDPPAYVNWALTYADNVTKQIQPNAAAGKDAMVNQLSPNPDTNYGSETYLKTGGDPGETLRTYIQFNLNPLPSTAVITSAGLSLWYYDIFPSAEERQLVAYKVTSSWNESLITWNNQPNFSTTVVDTETVPASATNSFITWDVTNLVKSWASGTVTNCGVMLSDSTGGEGFKVFYSSDWGNASQRPELTITYWDPAPLIIE